MSGLLVWVRLSVLLSFLALVAPVPTLSAETRLPANRIYITFIQGLVRDALVGEFQCLRFLPNGTFQVGGLSGTWSIDEGLSGDARAVRLRVDPVDDDPRTVEIDGLCWLDDLGSKHTLACSAHGLIPMTVDGAPFLGFGNFGWVGRPLQGALSAATSERCRSLASRFDGALASR